MDAKVGPHRGLNPGPPPPKGGIIPPDHADCIVDQERRDKT